MATVRQRSRKSNNSPTIESFKPKNTKQKLDIYKTKDYNNDVKFVITGMLSMAAFSITVFASALLTI